MLGYESATLDGNTGTDNSVQNAYNLAADYTVLPQDVRHTLVISSSYQLPFGEGMLFLNKGRIVNGFVGGFTVSGIQRYQSGFPFSFLVSSNALPLFNRYQRPNVVPGVDLSTHTSVKNFNPVTGSNLFNAAAFALPGNSSFGNASPTFGNLRNYAVLSEDLQLTKRTRLTENLLWSFYAQAFNPFNRHRLTGFGTSLGAC